MDGDCLDLDAAVLRAAEQLWDYHCLADDPVVMDWIIGLGSYDLRVADHCAGLYLSRMGSKVVFTGNLGNWTDQLFDEPEAKIFRRRAEHLGVPTQNILVEPAATNIGENLSRTRDLIESHASGFCSAIVVTKGNTLRRVRATAEKVWPELNLCLDCPTRQWRQAVSEGWTRKALIHEMVGDLQRVLIYPGLGFQSFQTVPSKILAAYHLLVDRGFDQHLMSEHPLA